MTDPFRHMSLRNRVMAALWVLNISLVLTVVAFALR
jgi:hypothetical protein